MLFHVTWQFIDRSEEGQRRSLAVFGKWQPPAGAEFKGFYGFVDGGGGVAIVEAEQCRNARPHDGAVHTVAAFHGNADRSDRRGIGNRRRGNRVPRFRQLAGSPYTL